MGFFNHSKTCLRDVFHTAYQFFNFSLQANRVFVSGSCHADSGSFLRLLYTHPYSLMGHEESHEKARNHKKTARPDRGYARIPVYLQAGIVFRFNSLQRKRVRFKGRRIEFGVNLS